MISLTLPRPAVASRETASPHSSRSEAPFRPKGSGTTARPPADEPGVAGTSRAPWWASLKWKLLIPAVLLTAAGMTAVYVTVLRQAVVLEQNQLGILSASARSIQDRIDRCVFERYGDVQAFALNPLVHRSLTQAGDHEAADIVSLLDRYAAAYGCYPISLIVSVDGKVVALNNQSPSGKPIPGAGKVLGRNLSETSWFREVKAGNFTTYKGENAMTGTYVEQPVKDALVAELYGPAAPAWTMSFTAPIKASDGKVLGYWHNVFDPGMLEQIVMGEYAQAQKHGLASTEFNVVRNDGALLIDVDPTETKKLEIRLTDVLKVNLAEIGDGLVQHAKKTTEAEGSHVSAWSARMKITQPGGYARSVPVLGYAGTGFTTFVRAEPEELYVVVNSLKHTVLLVTVVSTVAAIVLFWWLASAIVRRVSRVQRAIIGLADGDIANDVPTQGRDEIAEMAGSFNAARRGLHHVFNLDRVDWKQVAAQRTEVARITSMMDQAPINVMFADKDLVIRYLNPASAKTLRSLQQHLPVAVDQMVGQSVDVFHKNPSHQRQLLGDPKNLPRQANINVGPEILELTVNPIFDLDQAYLGSMVTWSVITEKLANAKREKEMTESLKVTLDTVSDNAQSLASASEELSAVAQQMSTNSDETSAQSNVVASASEQVSKNVATVATSAEEMSASVREIAKNANDAARVATTAVKVAEETNKTVTKLGESSMEIGKVIKVITSIAEQTNLLALNATIEAARAGEAGKGFAVVANEVKELAKQTAAATEDISAKIEAIQTDTKGAVVAIADIAKVIGQINDISNTIASAVEEQSATTNEIARNASEAAKGSNEISRNIANVSQAARSTTEGANNTLAAAQELARLSTALKAIVDRSKTG